MCQCWSTKGVRKYKLTTRTDMPGDGEEELTAVNYHFYKYLALKMVKTCIDAAVLCLNIIRSHGQCK